MCGSAGHERVVAEPHVLGGVRDDHRLIRQDGVPAEGDGAGRLGRGQPARRLEPLAVGVDQGEEGHRDPHDERQQPGDAVEPLLRRGVEEVEGMQCRQAFGVVLGDRCGDHRPTSPRIAKGPALDQELGRCLSSPRPRQRPRCPPRRRLSPSRPARPTHDGRPSRLRSVSALGSPRSGAIGTKGRSADGDRTRRTHRRGTLRATLGPAIPLRSGPPCGRKSSRRPRRRGGRSSRRAHPFRREAARLPRPDIPIPCEIGRGPRPPRLRGVVDPEPAPEPSIPARQGLAPEIAPQPRTVAPAVVDTDRVPATRA